MRIAFVGKGGSGKTTLSSLFIRSLEKQNKPVIAIDADINQHLGTALGLSENEAAAIPALGYNLDDIKDYLAGTNSRVRPLSLFLKSSPPAEGSRLLRVQEENPIFEHYSKKIGSVRLMVTGVYDEQDIGLKCYHGKQGAAEIILNHLVDTEDEYVVTDLTAGADSFASGIFLKFDMTFLVAEPTTKSLTVYRQYKEYAKDHNIVIKVIGNKVDDESDEAFIRSEVGDDYFGSITRSKYIKSLERGVILPFDELEPENKAVLTKAKALVDVTEKDWATFHQRTLAFHRKKAATELDMATRTALLHQIDEQHIYET